jgi:ABC-2 type transport system permease protein
MYKLWVIAHREYVAMVGTKAFVFTLVMMPILMFGSLVALPLIQRVTGGKTHTIVVSDGTGELFTFISQAAQARNQAIREGRTESKSIGSAASPRSDKSGFMMESDVWEFIAGPDELTDADRLRFGDQIRDGKIHALVEFPPKLLAAPNLDSEGPANNANPDSAVAKYYSQDALISQVRGWLSAIVSRKLRERRIQQFGLESVDPRIIAMLDSKIELSPNTPMRPSDAAKPTGQSTVDTLVNLFLPFGVMMLMFMVIFMAAQPMLESAMEEKNLRISEVLLGSVSPTQLMGGKLLGNVAGSLVIFVLYGAGGLFLLNMQGLSDRIPYSIVPWFLLFQLLGVLFFSSIFLTVGASVNELKEAQTLLLPVWMVLMAPMMVWFIAVRDPNGIVATTLSFFPPSCPLMMVLRLASGTNVPFWQPWAGAAVMIASTVSMVWISGRIYRTGLLRNEGVRSIAQLVRRSLAK